MKIHYDHDADLGGLSQMTPPDLFKQYMVPYFQPLAERLHQRGKVLACHADGDTSLLLDLITEAGFDMAECFVTAPMVPGTLQQARAAFGDKLIIWGDSFRDTR